MPKKQPVVLPSPPKVYTPPPQEVGADGPTHWLTQLLSPTPDVKPGGQLEHWLAPARLKLPALHCVAAVDALTPREPPPGQALPAGHCSREVALADAA